MVPTNKSSRKSSFLVVDALAISAHEAVKQRKQDEWQDMMEEWFDNPESAANHMVFGMNLDQRRQARGKSGGKSVPTWV